MKRIALISLLCLLLLIFTSCNFNSHDTGKDIIKRESFLIFNYGYNELLIKNFMAAYPEIEIDVKNLNGTIYDAIDKYGEPDILLLTSRELGQCYEAGLAADISEYLLADSSYDVNSYFYNSDKVGEIDDKLIALPLSCKIPYWTTSNSKWTSSALGEMADNYSTFDVLTALNREYDQAMGLNNYLVIGREDVDVAGWLYGIGAIDSEKGILLNENEFDLIYQMQRKLFLNKGENSAIVEQFYMPFCPYLIDNSCLCISYGYYTAPQTGVVLENSLLGSQIKDSVKVLWRPSYNDNNTFFAEVECLGIVGTNSVDKYGAYQLLRKMMDMPISYWAVSTSGELESTMCPVNIESAIDLLTVIEDSEPMDFILNYNVGQEVYNVPKEVLTDEVKSEIINVLDHTILYQRDWDLSQKINERANLYINGNTMVSKSCFGEIVGVINEHYHK